MKEGQDQREAIRSKDRLIKDSHRTIFPLSEQLQLSRST